MQAWTKPGPTSIEGEHLQRALRQPLAAALSGAASGNLDPVDGLVRDGEMGGGARAQVSVPGDLLEPRARGALPQRLSRAGAAIGYEALPSGQLGWASPVYVADTDERAARKPRKASRRCSTTSSRCRSRCSLPPGYMSLPSMKNTTRMRKALGAQKRLTLEELADSGTVVVGSPEDGARPARSKLRDETQAGKLITMLQFGTLSDELTKRNMEMFTSEVMPHLETECSRKATDRLELRHWLDRLTLHRRNRG